MFYITLLVVLFFCVLFKISVTLLRCKGVDYATACSVSCELVSSLHSVGAVTVGGIIAWTTRYDVINAQSSLTDPYSWVWLAYGLYDLGAMYYVNCVKKDVWQRSLSHKLLVFVKGPYLSYILHHVIFCCVVLPLWMLYGKGRGHFFCGCFLLDSLSNPFVNARAIMHRASYRDNLLYRLNYIVMTVAFFCCKMLLFPFMFYWYAVAQRISFSSVPFRLPIVCPVGSLLVLALYCYWFVPMVRGCRKVVAELVSQRQTTAGKDQD